MDVSDRFEKHFSGIGFFSSCLPGAGVEAVIFKYNKWHGGWLYCTMFNTTYMCRLIILHYL